MESKESRWFKSEIERLEALLHKLESRIAAVEGGAKVDVEYSGLAGALAETASPEDVKPAETVPEEEGD